jgi:CO/xanthine dehydrogenase Mo-binding subunit
VGFSKEGRITSLDMYAIGENGPYEQAGDAGQTGRIVSLLYQPEAMHFRTSTVLTNTPPRRAQSQPGGMQGIMLMEPVVAKAARKLGIDQVAIRKINAPAGRRSSVRRRARGQRGYATSSFMKEALDKGAAMFNWEAARPRAASALDEIRASALR